MESQGSLNRALELLEGVDPEHYAMGDYILRHRARILTDLNRCDEAQAVWKTLLNGYSGSRWAKEARRGLDSCFESGSKRTLLPNSSDPCPGMNAGKALADCFFESRRYESAKEAYKNFIEQSKRKVRPELLVRLSQAAARSQDFETAIEANETIVKKFPKSRWAKEAIRKKAFLEQDSGDFQSALETWTLLLKKTKATNEKRLFWQKIAWCHFRLENYDEAIQDYNQALDFVESPGDLYWKGRSLERLGRSSEARDIFENLVLIYPASYYGVRALERLDRSRTPRPRMAGWWRRHRGRLWERSSIELDPDEGLDRIHELTLLGLFEDASIELKRLRAARGMNLPSDPKRLKWNRGVYRFEDRISVNPDPLFPLPYGGVLMKAAENKTPEPSLLYAMMKQESHFREQIISPAGAIGLLQIMPATGRRLATDAGWKDYENEWLTDPVTNIELGVRYMDQLQNLFSGSWYAAVASYNAGEHPVSQWVKQRKGLPEEEFIEEIPYAETREYVKRVYTNWRAYQTIYSGF